MLEQTNKSDKLQVCITSYPIPPCRDECGDRIIYCDNLYNYHNVEFAEPGLILAGISFPKFLSPFFDENSIIFLGGMDPDHPLYTGYAECNHTKMRRPFKLIIRWMKQLIVNKQWPSINEMSQHGLDLQLWL